LDVNVFYRYAAGNQTSTGFLKRCSVSRVSQSRPIVARLYDALT